MHFLIAQAQSASLSPHFSITKIVTVLLLFVAWSFAVQWVDRDAQRVNTRREWWNLLILGAGLAGLAVLLLFPWRGAAFFLGLSFWCVPAAGTLIAYVVHRNNRVGPSGRVMTPAHFRRLVSGEGGRKERVDKGVRVRLIDSAGKPVDKPADMQEADQYEVAQEFLFDMLWKRASDADILVGAEAARVVYKIDGVVAEQEGNFSQEEAARLLNFMKRFAGLNAEERRRPQAGMVRVGLIGAAEKPDSMQVRTSGSSSGERLTLRLNRAKGLMNLEQLGVGEAELPAFAKVVEQDTGLVVFAGPRESGITTTQYAVIRSHDAYLHNIYTLEQKKMLDLDNITQQVFDPQKSEGTYARSLQTVLRREPDVVLVDQCEDRETLQLACRAATEKKIYLTVRASNCVDAITRMQALLEDPKALAATLTAVVSERLLRVLCPACREAYVPDDSLVRKANLPSDKIEHFYRPPSEPIVDKRGREIVCQTCQNSRYVGRTGVFELLVVSDAMRKLIAQNASSRQVKGQARTEGMRYLQEQALLQVMDGTTSMAEVMRGLKSDAK